MERDYFMTAEEALAFGLVDKVLSPRSAALDAGAGQEKR